MINRIQHNFGIAIVFSLVILLKFTFLGSAEFSGAFFDFFSGGFFSVNFVGRFLFFILSYTLIFQLSDLINRNKFFDKRSYSFWYLIPLILSLGEINTQVIFFMIVNLFVLFIFSQLFRIQKGVETRSIPFNSSFVIGVISLFYFPFIFLAFLVLTAITSLRVASIKEFLASFSGLILPFFVVSSINFISGQPIFEGIIIHELSWINFQLHDFIFFVIYFLIVLYSLTISIQRISHGSIFEKSAMYVFFTLSVIMLCIYMISGDILLLPVVLIVPFSFFISNFWFYYKGNYVKIGMLSLLFLLSLVKTLF